MSNKYYDSGVTDEEGDFDTRSTGKLIYYQVPGSIQVNNADVYQYLRLENYANHEASETYQADGLDVADSKGITVHAQGYLLLKAKNGSYESFGNALQEKVSGSDHAIVIEKGDWNLVAEKGSISMKASNTGTTIGKMSLIANGCDIQIKAPNGRTYASDVRNEKTSYNDSISTVAGSQVSHVEASVTQEDQGGTFGFQLLGDLYAKNISSSSTAIAGKVQPFSFSMLGFGLTFLLVKGTIGTLTHKQMLIYNKLTCWQIYKTFGKSGDSLFDITKEDLSLEQITAKCEKQLVEADCAQEMNM